MVRSHASSFGVDYILATIVLVSILKLLSKVTRRPIIGVMGSHDKSYEDRTVELGRWIAERGYHLLTGAGGGVMMSVSKAFAEVPDRHGLVVGVVPAMSDDPRHPPVPGYPNPWIELPIYTHLAVGGRHGEELTSRNHVNILTSTVVVLLPGAEGTVSEAKLAVRYATPCVAFLASRTEILALPDEVPSASGLAAVAAFVTANIVDH